MGDNKNYGDHVIEGHDYDGIQELNNPLPAWWLGIFWATSIFGLAYYIYYEFAGGPTLDEELQTAMSKIEAVQVAAKEDAAASGEPAAEIDLAALAGDAEALKKGATVYGQFCAQCHGPKGEGTIGPNLTDEFWIHSKTGSAEDVVKFIKVGFPAKGMPPWEASISAEDIAKTAVYVLSLKGSNPPGAKAPQGEKVTQ